MSMAAVGHMTRELSTEWSGRGVRVNAIVCGQASNKDLEQRMADDPRTRRTFLRGIPMGRLGVNEDIEGIALLPASDASSFIIGALIPLDGGNLARKTIHPRRRIIERPSDGRVPCPRCSDPLARGDGC
jgi:NAD(P)-dependent dehydrogenase (short-subunit alcohol dehydrogenase family)